MSDASVDLDLLADYLGGALDGTAEAAYVADRIAADSAWASAATGLRAADAAVRADLARYAAAPVDLPVDVAARLDAALAGAEAAAPGATIVPLAARRRRYRWAMSGAAAAAVLAVVALGLGAHPGGRGSVGSSSGEAGSASVSAPGGRAAAPQPGTAGYTREATGTDYTPVTVTTLTAPGPAAAPLNGRPDTAAPSLDPAAVPEPLRRLLTAGALSGCLTALAATYPGRPLVIDFARYQGAPALVVLLGGTPQHVVVVGPDCGRGGADVRYATPLR